MARTSTPTEPVSASPTDSRPASANQLLRQLRDLAKELPGGLDETTIARKIADTLVDQCDLASVAVFARAPGGSTLLATQQSEGVDSGFDHALPPEFGSSNRSKPLLAARNRLVIPITTEEAVIGYVSCWSRESLTRDQRARATTVVREASWQFDSARLFSEIRTLATVEERHRLAREIHDGIAQEVASLGYVVDGLLAESESVTQRAVLTDLRTEVSRIVTELRLSIFDLRSDVGTTAGLVGALAAFVRQIGATSALTIHLVLAESTTRLEPQLEFEMLRIAQEAITNVVKHAKARNLWVTCRVEPPDAMLRVVDDGSGRGDGRPDSFGLHIMSERAERAHLALVVRDRDGGGTVVEIRTKPRERDQVVKSSAKTGTSPRGVVTS